MKNLQKLQKLVANVEGESVTNLTKEELNASISDLLDFLEQINKKNRSEFESVVQKMSMMLQEGRSKIEQDLNDHKMSMGSMLDSTSKSGQETIAQHQARVDALEEAFEARFGELLDIESPEVQTIVEALKPHIPKPLQGSPDRGEEIRNKLENLKGDERLDKTAVKGLDDYEEVKKLAKSPRGGGATALFQLVDVDVQSTKPTSGQALAYNATLDRWVPSNAGAGDVIKVGTPANNQVGVWTGDGTIEGDAALTFDTSTDTLTSGAFNATGLTASEIVVTDASKNLASAPVATYPSLTELSYVKGVTSAIQTQIGTKAPTASPTFTGTVTLPVALTGVIRADSGVVSVDTDVTDIVAAGTEGAAGKLELATTAEVVTGTDTARAVTAAGVTAKMSSPGAIGNTTASTGKFTTLETTGNIELGAASDTTLARVSAGVVSIEGKNILTTDGGTLTGNITLGENTSIDLDPAGSADGKYSGICITGTAGAALAFGDLIYLAAADSRWELTDADASATGGPVLVGMCVLAAAGDGSATKILLQGQIRADAKFPALTIGAPVYLGETAGAIQTAIPTGADNVIRVVGFALTADEIYFNPSQDHQLSVA